MPASCQAGGGHRPTPWQARSGRMHLWQAAGGAGGPPGGRWPQAAARCHVRCGGGTVGRGERPGALAPSRPPRLCLPCAKRGAGGGPCGLRRLRCQAEGAPERAGPLSRPGETPVGWLGGAWAGGVRPAGGLARRGSLGGRRGVCGGGSGLAGGVQASRTRRRRGGPARREGLVVGWRGAAWWHGERRVGRGVQERPGASPAPNKRLQPTPYSLRSAAASRRG